RPPPRPPAPPLFPYTTLFRSGDGTGGSSVGARATTTGSNNRVLPTVSSAVRRVRLTTAELASVTLSRNDPVSAAATSRGGCGCRSEEHTSELQSRENLVCRLL